MKPQLSQTWQRIRFASAIALLAIALLLSLALWAPDHQTGISLWWALAAIVSAVQASLMMRAQLLESGSGDRK